MPMAQPGMEGGSPQVDEQASSGLESAMRVER